MSEIDTERPWELLSEHLESEDQASASALLSDLSGEDKRRAFSRLTEGEQAQLVELLDADIAAELIEHLPEVQASSILEELSPESAADIFEILPDDLGADLLSEMEQPQSEAVLAQLDDAEEAEHLRELSSYDPDSAGGLMTDVYASFDVDSTVADVLRLLTENAEKYGDMDVQYVYVVDDAGVLKGVLRLRDLVLGSRSRPVSGIMIGNPVCVGVNEDLDALSRTFEERAYLGLPVIDTDGVLKGVVSRKAVENAAAKQQTDDYLHVSGIVGGEELRSMPLLLRSRRRLAWLAPNIILNIIAASVIAMYEDTLQAVIALAIFLPIISDMSGCSGNQAVAVSIRELTLGLIRPTEYLRVIMKEGILGVINGVVLGILLGTIAGLWKSNLWLGLVVGGALTLNTILAVLLGGLVPLFLKRLKVDPALASGPILTTCTDMCGFFLVLNIASAVLSRLM